MVVEVLVEVLQSAEASLAFVQFKHAVEDEAISQWGAGPPESRELGLLSLINTMLAAQR